MCGRFTLIVPTYEVLAQALGIVPNAEQAALYRPRYNVAPTDPHWVLRLRHHTRELVGARWGLVPSWSKRVDQGGRPINARAESIETKPVFRDSFARRRCVVVADGFFEWQKNGKERQPLWFTPRSGGLLFLAGLDARWVDPETSEVMRTFTIVTTVANDLVAPVHDRMPVILAPTDVDTWMTDRDDRSSAPGIARGVTDEIRALLRPAPADSLVATPVSKRVGSVKNDDLGCIAPLDDRTEPIAATNVRTKVVRLAHDLAVGESGSLFPGEPLERAPRRKSSRA